MTLRERQDQFIETIGQIDSWADKFNFLMDYSNLLENECPDQLKHYPIERCQSRTFFKVLNEDGNIRITGWSNSAILGGVIVTFMKIFDGVPVKELQKTDIDFHIRSGLIDNLTALRQSALSEMLHQILSFQKSGQ